MANYTTPGVYIEEVSTLPPTVAGVSTAVPAFIGKTKKHQGDAPVVEQISSYLEFAQTFGGPEPTALTVGEDGAVEPVRDPPGNLLAHAMRHYYLNGGGRCFVVSVANLESTLSQQLLLDGLAALAKEDEPTLVLAPELIQMAAADYVQSCQSLLKHCAQLKDRFAILDLKVGTAGLTADILALREGVSGADNLQRGAVYGPYLRTTLVHEYDPTKVTVAQPTETDADAKVALSALEETEPTLFALIQRNLSQQRVVLPPSAAVAGAYCRIDRQRGVWKAPANEALAATIAPTVGISDEIQESMNVHSTGMSINAIRAFAGRGVLIWGARTLLGNSNEWRYVPVRRLFIMIEESVKNASAFAVFEPNDANTWLKVKGMIESFLYGLWEQGALQGATPEQAYFVHVGLGTTMGPQDILEGKMIVEIGCAAVRAAEFLILRFSHMTAQS